MKRGAALLLLAMLSGCAMASRGGEGIDAMTTGSIAPAPQGPPVDAAQASPVVASVAAEDWESMRSLAAAKLDKTATGTGLDWTNVMTGDSGTLAPLADAKSGPDGLSCRPVALTVSDVHGVRRYTASACSGKAGAWQLHDVTAEDMVLVASNNPKTTPPGDPAGTAAAP